MGSKMRIFGILALGALLGLPVLYLDLPVTVTEAALGTEVELPCQMQTKPQTKKR